jgi:hypothetical protein
MSWQPSQDPLPGDAWICDAIEMVIVLRADGGRRADGRAAPRPVELRILVRGSHSPGQGRLEGAPVRGRAGRQRELVPLPE